MQSEVGTVVKDKALKSSTIVSNPTESDARRKPLIITMAPTVDLKGEDRKCDLSGMANAICGLGDVCEKLKKCVTSVQNHIMESLLPSLVVMGRFGETGHRDGFERVHHFSHLKTVVLETSFTNMLKNYPSSRPSEQTSGDSGRGKFFLLPQWEQRFLGMERRQCLGRTVLAFEGPSRKTLDCFVSDEKRN
ncbi:unnamed protein product [Hydatigera taeniaeformis]|uniref:Uncharacterized protein n=1 Tax=Hydatigena taeniaeformis TaxID=6205 RepID=A0A0R3WKX4_HYDTA|nr:unnamed protein product [Hydatigera taeniaeformis]